ncbi:hypothetical protein Zmor_012717 [Zophobas morio]|uniref:Uncharacterized protein n=1 Tax=Zophobas morio TaxID=2755281 RepID=A0AA38MEL7_9CUCU|nr:hypothetical protein Zmor_012717 [Zophobas morio]
MLVLQNKGRRRKLSDSQNSNIPRVATTSKHASSKWPQVSLQGRVCVNIVPNITIKAVFAMYTDALGYMECEGRTTIILLGLIGRVHTGV